MPSNKKLLQAAAGSAGGDPLYVEDVFSTYLYNGTGSSNPINNGIDLSGEGGLVWGKRRNLGNSHWLIDTVRGIDSRLESDGTGAATDKSSSFTAFNDDGFTVASTDNEFNNANGTYASWTFRKAEKFFDIVNGLTSDSSGNLPQFNHNLGSTPGCVIMKATDSGSNWVVFHKGLSASGANQYIQLNSTNAATNATGFGIATDTTFEVGAGSALVPSVTYVAYLFASDAGGFGEDEDENIIKCGSYTGGGTSQVDVSLGWEPQWLLLKRIQTSGYSWFLFDTMRGWGTGFGNQVLQPNAATAEYDFGQNTRPTADGFRTLANNGNTNLAGIDYMYIAIRRPMKTPESGTEVYTTIARAGNNVTTQIPTGFTTDMFLSTTRNQTWYHAAVWDRLRGTSKFVLTSTTGAEQGNTAQFTSFDQDGITVGPDSSGWINNAGATYVYNLFKRAPGFMDVIAYRGDESGTFQAVPHNLTVIPELVIIKPRNTGDAWQCGSQFSATQFAFTALNSSNGYGLHNYNSGYGDYYSAPTSTAVNVLGSLRDENTDFVGYLFATLAGVSKVGTYTATGSNLNVDCGFTAGARFILIKRTDSTGDWYTYDSVRGIVAGNDPYLLLNSSAAEVTGTDYIDPLNAGFTVTSNASSTVNVNGGTYTFLAIA